MLPIILRFCILLLSISLIPTFVVVYVVLVLITKCTSINIICYNYTSYSKRFTNLFYFLISTILSNFIHAWGFNYLLKTNDARMYVTFPSSPLNFRIIEQLPTWESLQCLDGPLNLVCLSEHHPLLASNPQLVPLLVFLCQIPISSSSNQKTRRHIFYALISFTHSQLKPLTRSSWLILLKWK